MNFSNIDELKNKVIEIFLYEVDKSKCKSQLNNIDIKRLEELLNKSVFYSGIKIDLLSVAFGPEQFDLPLMKIDPITSRHINIGRITFKLKSNELCSYTLIISNLLISSTMNKELSAVINMEFKDCPSYQSEPISLTIGNQSKNKIELITDIISIDDLYKGILNMSIYDKAKLICSCSLSEYKEDLMFKFYDSIINSKNDNSIAYNNIPILLNEKEKASVSFEISIETSFAILQMKKKILTENGVVNCSKYLYANFSQCTSSMTRDDTSFSIHHMI